MTRRPFVIGAAVLVLAACSPGGPGLPGASPSTKGDLQQMLQISRQFSQCVRDHGHANFPDALIDVDEVVYPDMPGLDIKAIVTEAEQIPECKAILDQLQSADGTFPINGTPLENEGKSERLLSALDACKSVYDKRIATS
jgi:hypothetical protein